MEGVIYNKMTTKADLRKIGERYVENQCIRYITNARERILRAAENNQTECEFVMSESMLKKSFCNAVLNGVKTEFPDIDVSESCSNGSITYTFSWKD